MSDYDHKCNHPTCYTTDEDATIYEVQSRHDDSSFEVCGEHLLERDLERATVASDGAASAANAEILAGLKS